ncbi:MAG: hypothetical protein ACOWW1_05435 [archaeon]
MKKTKLVRKWPCGVCGSDVELRNLNELVCACGTCKAPDDVRFRAEYLANFERVVVE